MKRAFLFLLILSSVAALAGCSEMSPEDREFYGRGWIHPGDLDKERPTQMPAHPETTGSLGGAPGTPVSSNGEQWAVPDRY